MAQLAYECNSELRSNNFTDQSEILKPFACIADKYCLYCCCNSQCCLLIHRRPPKHFWEAWYFWLGIALLVLFILSSISSYIVSNCRHNFRIMTIRDNRSTQPFSNNERVNEMLANNHNEISIHVIPTAGMMLPTNDNKMFLCPPQPNASYMKLTIGNKEIRCYCNQPECVPQGYMCRGISGCFTKLPSQNAIIPKRAPSSLFKPGHSVYNGCLVEREQCPPEFLCCSEDLCNHVDSPAVMDKLNKTLRILMVGDTQEQQQQDQLHQPTQQDELQQKPTIQIIKSVENYWFKTATIAICICGIVVMLILMSLAIRLLQPVFPMQTIDKRLGVHLVIENTPTLLLESPKMPLA